MRALGTHPTDPFAYARAALDAECAELGSTEHGRNKSLFDSAKALGHYIPGGYLNRPEVEHRLSAAAQASGYVAKDGPSAVRSTVRSGIEIGMREPKDLGLGAPRSLGRAARPRPALSGVDIPDWTVPKAEEPGSEERPKFTSVGKPEPHQWPDEARRHRYVRDGEVVRVKVKRTDGQWIDWYRVRRPGDGAIGWQSRKPAGFVACPYLPPGAPIPFTAERCGEDLTWAEGEKDADALHAHGFNSFTFGSAGDTTDVSSLLHDHAVLIAVDNDDAGGKSIPHKVGAAIAAGARSVRLVRFDGQRDGFDAADFFEAGGTAEDLLDLAERIDPETWGAEAVPPARLDEAPPPGRFAEVPPPPRGNAPLAVLKPLDVFLAEYEPLEYALEPIVRTGSLYTLTARTGAGKTAWLISVALAVAAGRSDILGLDVEPGRVALLTFENPDDVRMRLKVSSWFLNVDVRGIVDQLLILDARVKPEEALVQLEAAAKDGPLRLVLVDTLAAFFDGDNINDNVQGGGFMRRLRPITRLSGRPAVVVAAHPVKNAPQDNLLPYGGGAILNEVDGNLTLWRRSEGPSGIVELHWQGKLRGLEFAPIPFRFEITTSPEVKDAKGREVPLPTMLPAHVCADDEEAQTRAEVDVSAALIKVMLAKPKASQREWGDAIGRAKSNVNSKLQRLKTDKLVEVVMGQWSVTAKGEKWVA